jgi:hypothetical protein
MTSHILINGRLLTAVLMLTIFATMTVIALGFPDKARLMPLLFGIPGTILGLLQVVAELRIAATESDEPTSQQAPTTRGERQMLVWLMLFFLGIIAFGFIYAAPVLVLAFLYFGKREPLIIGIVSAIGIWVVLYGLFELGFEIQLFDGLVVEWLRS